MVVTLFVLAEEEEVAVVASASELTSVVVEAVEMVPTHVEMVMVLVEDYLHLKDLDQVLQHHLLVLVMLVTGVM